MSLEQARSLARYAFARLWRSEVMTVRAAFHWLQRETGFETIDELPTVDDCERVVGGISRIWAERCADPCEVCRIPVRQDHGHEIVNGRLLHSRCLESYLVTDPEVASC